MTNKQIPVWIDCDTGTDDSVAIMLAHALPELSVIGLSAVAGNSPLYNTFPNTRRVVHLLGADYPVYPGAERPLVREPHVAGKFHGETVLETSSYRCQTRRQSQHSRGTRFMQQRSACRANCVWLRPDR